MRNFSITGPRKAPLADLPKSVFVVRGIGKGSGEGLATAFCAPIPAFKARITGPPLSF